VLGALLHDIGKGYPGDHTEVGMELIPAIGPRWASTPPTSRCSSRMVEHHLLLPDVAMRRDLTDPATIEQVADAVESVEVLDLLHALTEADSLATGPSAWGDWKEGLVAELVARVRHVLGGGDVAEVTWRLFPDAETLAVMAAGELDISRRGDVITVVSPDASGTFSRIAGVLSLHGLDVVSAQAHSDESGVAASQFRIVVPENGLNWRSVKADLARACGHSAGDRGAPRRAGPTYRRRRRTQAAAPAASAVGVFDDAASSNATVIVVRAPTRSASCTGSPRRSANSASTSATPPCRRSAWRSSTPSTCAPTTHWSPTPRTARRSSERCSMLCRDAVA
jgi:[protein-PII] uridylyltransferase